MVVQRTYYGVYFKKDVSHKSDWEYAILEWHPDGSGNWVRDSVSLEVDGKRGGGYYGDIPSTFDSSGDQFEDGNQGRDHPKLFFGKHHHAVHWDTSGNFKSTCGVGTDDFRSPDFQFWSTSHLRHIDNIDPNWDYGGATNPHVTVDGMCN